MKKPQYIRFFAAIFVFACFAATSCKQVSNAIENLLTFSITKTAPAVPIPPAPLTPENVTIIPPQGIPIGIDSADLAKQKTAISLVKTLKLTGWAIAIDDSMTWARTNID